MPKSYGSSIGHHAIRQNPTADRIQMENEREFFFID